MMLNNHPELDYLPIIYRQDKLFATPPPTYEDYIKHASGHDLTGATWALWKYFSKYFADPEKNECSSSVAHISDCLNCTVRTVRRAVATLRELGLIEVEKRLATTNIYRPVGIQENMPEKPELSYDAHSRRDVIGDQVRAARTKKRITKTFSGKDIIAAIEPRLNDLKASNKSFKLLQVMAPGWIQCESMKCEFDSIQLAREIGSRSKDVRNVLRFMQNAGIIKFKEMPALETDPVRKVVVEMIPI